MNDQDRFAFPEPLGDEPRRFTPLLAVAGLVGALALVAIVYLLFFGGGGGPGPSPSRTPGATASTSPGASPGATPTLGSGEPATVAPGAAADLAAQACANPLPPFDGLQPDLLEGFRGYCIESLTTVLVSAAIDPSLVGAAGWAFTNGGTDAEGAAVSRVFVSVSDERRVRRYLVSHVDGGAMVVGEPDRVRTIADDLLVFSWTRE